MAGGDRICDVCGKYDCICSNVIKSFFGHELNLYESPDIAWSLNEAYNIIDEIEYEGCCCNSDYICNIHEKINELRNVLRNKQSSRAN